MLDQETRRRIDAARDVLVGKVPDPKSQIEQITIALIYKFMDDMDMASQELGGEPRFFTGEYKRFAWSKLMDPRLGAQERMNLYVEAMDKLPLHKHMPLLFRDIFKGAMLPYRDPNTLSMFLKEIEPFTYDHSERLGDAFEYLLSLGASQGEAGQFRTPRHIIKFITDVVDPKKGETVLDPACGTAGFLVEAYKHILETNTDKRVGDKLTPDERETLVKNFVGYDISPDMVRLSRANLYLHGFQDPKIFEYDTLTSEDRWQDKFDVILANPPFMSPKGGIKPHSKFSIKANRSEVLFVDYIMEHLSQSGRAGIIVPEGILFKSDVAYKTLRKALINDGLFAVVSLPPGVFNPYSGVKTSILFFDNRLAKLTDQVLFIKVLNDGFDLGAQRRERSDLPNDLFGKGGALDTLQAQMIAIETGNENKFVQKNSLFSWLIDRKQILESRDHNLSSDRYQSSNSYTSTNWPIVELGEVCTFEYGKPLKEENRHGGDYPVFGSNGIVGWHDEYLVQGPLIVVGRKGTAGAVTYSEKSGFPIDTTFYVQLKDVSKIDLKFLYYVLRQADLDKVNTQAGVPGLNRNDAYLVKIPLPPLTTQKEIVKKIETKQNAILEAKQNIDALESEIGEIISKI